MVLPGSVGETAARSKRWPAGRIRTTIICFFVFACMNTLFVRTQEGWRVAGPGNRIVSATMARMRKFMKRSQTDPWNEAPGGRVPSSNPALVPEPQDLVPVYECWHAYDVQRGTERGHDGLACIRRVWPLSIDREWSLLRRTITRESAVFLHGRLRISLVYCLV